MDKNEMKTYIAILRGINVSGKNMIKMPELVKTFESLAFENVRTYVQSGNVIFEAESAKTEILQKHVQEQIETDFKLTVPILVLTKDEIAKVIAENPFIKRKEIDLAKLHVTFLSQEPIKENIAKINRDQYLPDEFVIDAKTIYIHCPDSYGKTKLNNNFFENKLKVTATTRNWKTVNTLNELAAE